MSRKRADAKCKTIGFKAFYGNDADILTWWEAMPEGERSDVLRELIRKAINSESRGTPQTGQSKDTQFRQVCEDTAWIRNALTDLPGYLERLVVRVTAAQAASPPVTPDSPPNDVPQLAQEVIQRRKANMRQNTW